MTDQLMRCMQVSCIYGSLSPLPHKKPKKRWSSVEVETSVGYGESSRVWDATSRVESIAVESCVGCDKLRVGRDELCVVYDELRVGRDESCGGCDELRVGRDESSVGCNV